MLWIGEVEDAKCIDDVITSASTTGDPIPDFDFKIASGLRKILTRNFKKQVINQKRDHLSGRQIAWMIYDFFTTGGDNDAILDF